MWKIPAPYLVSVDLVFYLFKSEYSTSFAVKSQEISVAVRQAATRIRVNLISSQVC